MMGDLVPVHQAAQKQDGEINSLDQVVDVLKHFRDPNNFHFGDTTQGLLASKIRIPSVRPQAIETLLSDLRDEGFLKDKKVQSGSFPLDGYVLSRQGEWALDLQSGCDPREVEQKIAMAALEKGASREHQWAPQNRPDAYNGWQLKTGDDRAADIVRKLKSSGLMEESQYRAGHFNLSGGAKLTEIGLAAALSDDKGEAILRTALSGGEPEPKGRFASLLRSPSDTEDPRKKPKTAPSDNVTIIDIA